MRFFYRHSRGVTEVVVGAGLEYDVENAVLLIEEGLRPPIAGVPTMTLSGGEEVKSLESLVEVYQFLAKAGVDRSSTIVAVGGGALLDLATFAAGTYMRGVGLVNVPTTLLAMVDAGLGGKGAVDWGPVKNLVGVFYQPKAVLCDLSWLGTLPDRVFRSALAEVVKYGVSLDFDFYKWLWENRNSIIARDVKTVGELVFRSLKTKAAVVEVDEFEERGIRQVLNVGHTVGHAVERLAGVLHGEAVSVGIVAELQLSRELGYLSEREVEEVSALLRFFGLPTAVGGKLEEAAALVKFDKKKRGSHIYMPVVVKLGKWILERVSMDDVVRALGYVLH